ncbi:DUF6665 family protein [Rhizobium grahamii]|uniref:DUF6665 family protein n=1 Tax=Rhizobium grahamii TaxID=1120045 RepID=UPI001FD5B99F|nr:DUF6665 family protein [Rhizobium grahamii]
MPLRLPQSISGHHAINPLEYELASERAGALGRQGRRAEAALAKLAAWSSDNHHQIDRTTLLDDASQAVWALFIQREICGLRNNREVIDRYQIPGEVLVRLGATRR